MRSEIGYEGSGLRALNDNDRVLAEAEQKLEELRKRAASGEVVDAEVLALKNQIDKLRQDRGRINSASMV
ncbi:MAG TPA: hypothetical protein VFX17_03050 [Patescibacteria group bacterium]|nr:hypothetical protein [Patescibacteria group bacterium]